MKVLRLYIKAFKGLRIEVWWLALITLINRAGSMVLPFLAVYLREEQGFDYWDVGFIWVAFGLGSALGSWIGGKLTDIFGNRPVMMASLILAGILYVLYQYVHGFWPMMIATFVVVTFADAFRPAMFVALKAYSKTENRARSISLIRVAINLGFAFGPAAAGILIDNFGYAGLFWIDGLTCGLAAVALVLLLPPRRAEKEVEKTAGQNLRSPYSDKQYWLFFVAMTLIAISFLQFFSTMPVYFREHWGLSKTYIGFILGFNGFFIFFLEMPLVDFFERPKFSKTKILVWSTILLGLCFVIFNSSTWLGVIWIGTLFITVGEMLNFPFSNSYAMERSQGGKQGAYMGMYLIAFALSHVFGHIGGFGCVALFGYEITMWIFTGILGIATILMIWLHRWVAREKREKEVQLDEYEIEIRA